MKPSFYALAIVCLIAPAACGQDKATIQGRTITLGKYEGPKQPLSIRITADEDDCNTHVVADYGECHVPTKIKSQDAVEVQKFISRIKGENVNAEKAQAIDHELMMSYGESLRLPITAVEDFFPTDLGVDCAHMALRVTRVQFASKEEAEQNEAKVAEALTHLFAATSPFLQASDFSWKAHKGRGAAGAQRLYFFDEKGRPSVVDNHPAPRKLEIKEAISAMEMVKNRMGLLDGLRSGITHETLRGTN